MGLSKEFLGLCFLLESEKFMVVDLMGEEWVLPAGMLPLAGADRKTEMLLMSSQRKPLIGQKSGCIFTLSLHAARLL